MIRTMNTMQWIQCDGYDAMNTMQWIQCDEYDVMNTMWWIPYYEYMIQKVYMIQSSHEITICNDTMYIPLCDVY